MEENRDIRGLLQEQFAHFEADPGVDLWAGIEAGLQAKEQPKRRVGMWVSIAASISLILGMLWLLRVSQPKAEIQQLAQEPLQVEPKASTIEPTLPLQVENTIAEGLTSETQIDAQPIQEQAVAITQAAAVSPSVKGAEQQDIPVQELISVPNKETPSIKVAPIQELASVPQEASIVDVPVELAEASPRPVATNREVYHPTNKLNFNDLTLGQALGFASREISKLTNSPVEVRHERSDHEEQKTYEVNFLNVHFASNESRKTAQETEEAIEQNQTFASSEPVEQVNSFQLDVFNFKIKRKTHKRVINKKKS